MLPRACCGGRTGVGPGGVHGSAGEPSDDHAGDRRAQQERAGTAAGEGPDLVHEVARLPAAEPIGQAVGPLRGLPSDLGHRSGLLAAVGHLPQLLAQRPDAVRGLLLAGTCLVLDLATGLAEEVARLCLHLLCHVRGLLGRRAGDLPSGVRRGASDVRGLVAGDLGGGLPGGGAGRGGRRVAADLLAHRVMTPGLGDEGIEQMGRYPCRMAATLFDHSSLWDVAERSCVRVAGGSGCAGTRASGYARSRPAKAPCGARYAD